MTPRRCLLHVATCCLVPIILSGCTTSSRPPDADAFTGNTGGCGDFFVFHTSSNGEWRLTVTVNRRKLPGAEIPQTLDLGTDANVVQVEMLRLGANPTQPCTCIAADPPTDRWKAIAGTLSITTQDAENPPIAEAYRVSVTLDDVELKHPETGASSRLETVEITNIMVGWYAG